MSSKMQQLESRAVRVTLFEDRAEVVRTLDISLEAGVRRLAILGVAAAVDDGTVVARLSTKDARVLSTRVRRTFETRPVQDERTLLALEEEVDAARARLTRAEQLVVRRAHAAERAAHLEEGLLEALARVPRGGEAGVSEWRASFVEAAKGRLALTELGQAGEQEADDARLALRAAEQRLEQARVEEPRVVAVVEVELESPGPSPCTLELTYRVPCALWRPEHLVQLVRGPEDQTKLLVRTWATVWQATGESWDQVQLCFSTARPAKEAKAPALTDDVLYLRKKTDAEKKQVIVEARDQQVEVTGASGGTRRVEEMPGVDDGGVPQIYEAKRPATLPSDGQPLRVEISELLLETTADCIAFPERSEAAYLRGRAVNPGPHPILAGPAVLMRGTEMVGKAKLPFVAVGDSFEVSLGLEDGVRVRRDESVKRETTPLTGTQKITKTVRVYLSNLSRNARKLAVKERFFVSELGEVSVELLSAKGGQVDGKDGFVTFVVELPPAAHQQLELAYRVEAAAKVVLPL